MASTLEYLERGLSGTERTIQKMHRLVALGKTDPTIQKIATWIRLRVPQDYRGATKRTADEVFRWVRRHAIFQRDPFQIEKIEHPIEAMRPVIEARRSGAYKGPGLFVGDCDTIAGVYLASLLGALGFHYAFETAKTDPSRPDEFSHVWVAVRIGDDWYPLDPSTPGVEPGWRPPVPPDRFKRWVEEPVENYVSLSGYLPEDFFYGIPQYRNGRAKINDPDPGSMKDLTPAEPAPSAADLEMSAKYDPPANDAINELPVDQPRPEYVAPTSERLLKMRLHPKGWVWSRYTRYVDPKTPRKAILRERFGPEMPKEVAVHTLEPFPVSAVRPEGVGQSVAPETAKKAAQSVWETIGNAVSGIIGVGGDIYKKRLEQKYEKKLVSATNRLAGGNVIGVADLRPPAPSGGVPTWALVGGGVALAGVVYVATRSSGGGRRGRR
jgi:hypothetical protein